MRRCLSFKEIREEEESEDEADANFISAPTSPREKEILHNPFFMGKMLELKRIYRERDFSNNCYADSQPAHYFPMRDCKLVTRKI